MTEYLDDSQGGGEARVFVALQAGQCRIELWLSWLAKQRNEYRFLGDQGSLSWGVYDLDVLEVSDANGLSPKNLRLPIQKLLAEKKFKTKGQRRGTKYFAGGRAGATRKKAGKKKARPTPRRRPRTNPSAGSGGHHPLSLFLHTT